VAIVALIFAVVGISMLSMPVIPAIVMLVPVLPVVLFLITRNIVAFIPVVLHKIDPFAASVVFAAMLAPMFGVILRNTQIDGRTVSGSPIDKYRMAIDQTWRWIVAYVELSIEAWLSDTD